MEEVFDIYTKKTRLYYTLLSLSMIIILFLVVAKVMNIQVPKNYEPILIGIIVTGIILIFAFMLLPGTDLVKMYIKDGELIVGNESIIIYLTEIPLNKIKHIIINSNDYRGARSSDGSGNTLEFYDNSNKRYFCNFVINSRIQRDNLRKIIESWRDSGVEIN